MTHLQHEIISDGRTVWVNDHTGFCTGRFSKFGIDVHKSLAAQIEGQSQCLACTHTRPTMADWVRFQKLMREHYGIVVEAKHRPDFLR